LRIPFSWFNFESKLIKMKIMITKILFICFLIISITFSRQNTSFTISEKTQTRININNYKEKIFLKFIKNNTDRLSFEISEIYDFEKPLNNKVNSIKEINGTDTGLSVKDIFSYLSGFLLLWISWLQYKFNKFMSRFNLYDKKFNVYKDTNEFLKKLLFGSVEISDCIDFVNKVSVAKFIFNDKVNNLLNEILEKGYKIASINNDLKTYNSIEPDSREFMIRKQKMQEKSALIIDSIKFRDNLDEIFKDTLKISN